MSPFSSPQPAPRSRRTLSRALSWGLSLGLLLLLGLSVELLLQQYRLRQHEAIQQRLTASAGEVRTVLLSELSSTLHLATGLASYITAKQGQLDEVELQPWLQGLLRQGRHIRNIGLAPDNRISYIYPLAGNEAALGLYYPDLINQWPAVQRIIASRTPVLDGPLQLVQGGNGLIYRVPVFLDDRRYWGMISTVIDYDQLYAQVEQVARQRDLSIRLIHRDDQASADLLTTAPDSAAPRVSLRVSFAGAHWRLEASERLAHELPLGWLRLLGWSLALAVATLIGLTLHAQNRQAALLLALNRSQRQFHQAFEMAPQGLALLDLKGRLLAANQTLCQLLRRSPQTLLGQPLSQFSDDPRSTRLDEDLAELGAAQGGHWQLRLLDAQGEHIDVELSAAALNADPSAPGSWIVHIQDIRERKRLQRLQNEFVSTVSHELRTPLTAISGPLELINAGALGEVPEGLRQMLQIAQHNSHRLGLLINDLLDIGKLEAGRIVFDLQPQTLQPLIEQALSSNQAYAAEYAVNLRQIGSCEDSVIVDGQRLQQVLANLLSNAAKFSPRGGDVELYTERLGPQLRLSVRDRGAGIPLAFQGRIFQKFAQADASNTRQKGGTGLGLAISKELIERMHGCIGFDSQEGQGTTFWFELPLQPTETQS
jgi:PAS domain S-box-containing protein